MSEQLNSTALHELAGSVHDIANRRAGVMSTYEVANLELAHEQLNRFAGSIEHQMPATDRPDLTRDQFSNDESYYLATGRQPSLPTREQIAEALSHAGVQYNHGASPGLSRSEHLADAVLALFQKGADR